MYHCGTLASMAVGSSFKVAFHAVDRQFICFARWADVLHQRTVWDVGIIVQSERLHVIEPDGHSAQMFLHVSITHADATASGPSGTVPHRPAGPA